MTEHAVVFVIFMAVLGVVHWVSLTRAWLIDDLRNRLSVIDRLTSQLESHLWDNSAYRDSEGRYMTPQELHDSLERDLRADIDDDLDNHWKRHDELFTSIDAMIGPYGGDHGEELHGGVQEH